MHSSLTNWIKLWYKTRRNNLLKIDIDLAEIHSFFCGCFSIADEEKDVQIKRSVLPSVV